MEDIPQFSAIAHTPLKVPKQLSDPELVVPAAREHGTPLFQNACVDCYICKHNPTQLPTERHTAHKLQVPLATPPHPPAPGLRPRRDAHPRAHPERRLSRVGACRGVVRPPQKL